MKLTTRFVSFSSCFQLLFLSFSWFHFPPSIVCPSDAAPYQVTMWTIMSKVRLEAMMWVSNLMIVVG